MSMGPVSFISRREWRKEIWYKTWFKAQRSQSHRSPPQHEKRSGSSKPVSTSIYFPKVHVWHKTWLIFSQGLMILIDHSIWCSFFPFLFENRPNRYLSLYTWVLILFYILRGRVPNSDLATNPIKQCFLGQLNKKAHNPWIVEFDCLICFERD